MAKKKKKPEPPTTPAKLGRCGVSGGQVVHAFPYPSKIGDRCYCGQASYR